MAGSSAYLRRLGAELRRLREEGEFTQMGLAQVVGRAHTSILNWEHGKTKISKSDLAALLEEMKAPAKLRQDLEKLRTANPPKGWWSTYKLPRWLAPLVSFERDAVLITSFEPVILPGLLQTEDYARAIHVVGNAHVSPADILDKQVAARMQRQKRLFEDKPAELHAVISEASLRLEVGGAEVMADQLWHLVRLGSAANIRIQVLPYRAGAHTGVASNLTVLHFAEPRLDPPLGYVDAPLGGHLIDDESDVAVLTKMFEEVSAAALPGPESVDFLARVMDEYRSNVPTKRRRKASSP